MTKRAGIRESSGNVFRDLGLSNPEERQAKARLAASIARIIEHRGMSQTEASKALGIRQPEVSLLVRGRLAAFSTERLMKFLVMLGSHVEIRVREPARSTSRGHLSVTDAAT